VEREAIAGRALGATILPHYCSNLEESMSTTVTAEQTERMAQVSKELAGLFGELESLQERALPLVEELENELHGIPLQPETKKMFITMRNLITKVG
jgi:hypothetical protein